MSTVVELGKRVSENVADFDRAMARIAAASERSGARFADIDWYPGRTRYLRRYRSKGIAMRRRAAGKRG